MRYTVEEIEPEHGIICYPWRIRDNKTKELLVSSFITKDGAEAVASFKDKVDGIVGLTLRQAAMKLDPLTVRATNIDGRKQRVEGFTDPGRVNVIVIDDIVTSIDYIG